MQIGNSTFHVLGLFPCACLYFCSPPAVSLSVCSFILLIAFILVSPLHLALQAGLWFSTAVGPVQRLDSFQPPPNTFSFCSVEVFLRVPWVMYIALGAKAHASLKYCLCSAFNNNNNNYRKIPHIFRAIFEQSRPLAVPRLSMLKDSDKLYCNVFVRILF